MPRRKSTISIHSLPVRVLCAFLACLLSLPAPELQANAGDQAKPPQEAPATTSASAPSSSITAKPVPPRNCPGPGDRGLGVGRRNPAADRWGEITVAQPKIWQFERVSALLDGLLRDVEGVSLGDLTQLDPSQQNGAALKFVQSALEVGVQYDQAAAVNNSNVLSSYNALHTSQLQQLDQYNNYMQTLTGERDRLASQYSAASNEVNALQALVAEGTASGEQQNQLADALSRQTSTQASLTSVNSLISGAGTAPTLTAPPTVTGTSVQGPASGSNMSSSLSGFSDVLKSLPQGVQNNLSSSLQSPSYPATKRLDNFITLLYERLAREISVLQDDLLHDPENEAFLVQFDVGLYPSKKAKDHVARVEFDLAHCNGCKVYSLYPGQSSYNLANYSGASKRNTFWGNALTLIGLGLSASYRRQTDTLQGSLVQSVYTAGFQNGVADDPGDSDNPQQSFGWYYGAAPFEQLVTPGIRSTFAMITVPRKIIDQEEENQESKNPFGKLEEHIQVCIDAGWTNRNDPLAQDKYFSAAAEAGKALRAPFYIPSRGPLIDPKAPKANQPENPPYDASVLTMSTMLKLPVSQDSYSMIAKRENKMHVLRMEYNTVYEPPDTAANTTVVQTTVQKSTQTTNPATGQTTGQTATQTTGTAVTALTAPVGGSSVPSPSPGLDPLPCPKGKCAAILIALDRPIDPNLAITIRGKPMMRVRDWRGRATSVLPPAQSGSDLAAATNTAGDLFSKQLAVTRGLLEIDQFAPNAWFALNSHEVLLNVSVDVASDQEFPAIQLVDPSGSFVIPHDLRRGFTELLINGFRLKPQTDKEIREEIRRQTWREDASATSIGAAALYGSGADVNAPITSGPYAFSTFLPLFSPKPESRNFFAVMGETGNDLLIGFTSRRVPQRETGKTVLYSWLETKTQVILEDRDWDFAWSLSCDAQGELLACQVPREEISRVYRNFLAACPDEQTCPGLSPDRQSLIQSLSQKSLSVNLSQKSQPPSGPVTSPGSFHARERSIEIDPTEAQSRHEEGSLRTVSAVFDGAPIGASGMGRPIVGKTGDFSKLTQNENSQVSLAARQRAQVFAKNQDLRGFARAFVSTMQLSIEQSDEEGKNVFYSAAPVHIGFLPLSDDYWREVPFKPWEFDAADSDRLTIRECNYLPEPSNNNNEAQDSIFVSVLGVRSWKKWLSECTSPSTRISSDRRSVACPEMTALSARPDWVELFNDRARCGKLTMPTATLANDPIVFEMEFPPHPNVTSTSTALRTTIAIPRSRLGPSFKLSEMQIQQKFEPPTQLSKGEPQKENQQNSAPQTPKDPNVWRIVIPVVNSACGDRIDLPDELLRSPASSDISKIDVQWRNGNERMDCPNPPETEPIKPKNAMPDSTEYKKWQTTDKAWLTARTEWPAKWQEANENWQAADQADRVRLYLEIPRTAIANLPDRVDVIRTTSDNVSWAIGALPDLKKLLLPYRLAIDPLSATHFALQGENAGVIDAVVLQGSSGNPTTQIPVAKGLDFALVILPSSSADSGTDTSSGGGAGTNNSTEIMVDASKPSVQVSTKNSSTPAKPAAKPGATPSIPSPSSADKSSPPKALATGTYAVTPFIKIGTAPPDPTTVSKANQAVADATKKLADATVAAKGAPKDQTKQDAEKTAKANLATAQAAAKTAAQPSQLYMPLPVTDMKGKPLTFTIAETKKPTTTTGANPTSTTCATTPCLLPACTVACPTTTQTAASKNP
jgi:hypothetical protein